MRKKRTVHPSQLEDVSVLWPGDIRALAEFVLRSFDARDRRMAEGDRGTLQTSRPTLHGLAGVYARIVDVPRSEIESVLEADGLYLGAIVEFDTMPGETDGP